MALSFMDRIRAAGAKMNQFGGPIDPNATVEPEKNAILNALRNGITQQPPAPLQPQEADLASLSPAPPTAEFDYLGKMKLPEPLPKPPMVAPIPHEIPQEPQIYNDEYKKQRDDLASRQNEKLQEAPPTQAAPKVEGDKPKHAPVDLAAKQKAAIASLGPDEDAVAAAAQEADDQRNVDQQIALEKIGQPQDVQQGYETEATTDNLRAAQDRVNSSQDITDWLKIAARIGGGMSGASNESIKANEDMAEIVAAGGKRNQAQLQERIALEKQDPNSQYSVAARQFINDKFGANIPEGISAADLDKTFAGPALKGFEAQENREAKADALTQTLDQKKELAKQHDETLKARYDEMKQNAQLAREESRRKHQESMDLRRDAQEDKNNRYYSGQLETLKKNAIQGGGTAGTQIRNKIQFADNLFGTVGADPNMSEEELEKIPSSKFNNVNKTMVAETAMELNRLLTSTGTPAQSTLKKLIPDNILMDATAIRDYATSNLNPAQQGEFIKQALKTAARIKAIGKTQNKELMSKFMAGTERIKKNVPESDYNAALLELKLDPADFDSSKKKASLPSNKIMDKIPDSEGLKAKFSNVDTMTEEELDAALKEGGR